MTTRARRRCGQPRAGNASFLAAMTLALSWLLAACASSPAQPAGPATTQQLRVAPVTAGGQPAEGYRVASTQDHANCEPGSEAIGQAYRCFAGNTVYDPCWAQKATTPTALCLPYPWSRTDVRLLVSAPLGAIPNEGGAGLGEPWGVELADGQRCVLAQGAHGEFDGHVIDYYCNAGLSLLRGLDESGPVWHASSVTTTSGQQARGPAEAIRIAWFGRPQRTPNAQAQLNTANQAIAAP
jgi:hypothetical protein